jgi:hypoxanthine phosphoribosyltransferase
MIDQQLIKDFFNEAVCPTMLNIFAVVSLLPLVFTLFIVFTGQQMVFPDKYLSTIIIISSMIIIVILTYNWMKYKIKVEIQDNTKVISKIMDELNTLYSHFHLIKNPENDVAQNLSFIDIEFAIYCLVHQIVRLEFLLKDPKDLNKYHMHKNLIIGIDRGGAIVGGLLGKSLVLPVTTVGIKYSFNSPLSHTEKGASINEIPNTPAIDYSSNLINVDLTNVERIILVDDAVRTGTSMKTAINLLETIKSEKNLKFEFITACVLREVMTTRPVLKDPTAKTRAFPDIYVYKTEKLNVNPPWDLTHIWDDEETTRIQKPNPRYDGFCNKVGAKK